MRINNKEMVATDVGFPASVFGCYRLLCKLYSGNEGICDSHIRGVPKNNWHIFHMGEVAELGCKAMVNVFFFVVLKSRPVFKSQK